MESLSSLHRQSLLARRLQSFHLEAETCLEFEPETFQQMAGLIFFYDTNNYVYLRVTYHEDSGICLGLEASDHGECEPLLHNEIPLDTGRIHLRGTLNADRLDFSYSLDGVEWRGIGPTYDGSKLSDDYVGGDAFTGAFVGLCAQDLSGRKRHADFDYFRYRENVELDAIHSRERAKKQYLLDNIPSKSR
jgi:xylan 1,4-beta-xylosidase